MRYPQPGDDELLFGESAKLVVFFEDQAVAEKSAHEIRSALQRPYEAKTCDCSAW